MFVCGTVDGIIKVSGRRHNCDDLKATILAVDPIKFVYRGRSVTKLKTLTVKNWPTTSDSLQMERTEYS